MEYKLQTNRPLPYPDNVNIGAITEDGRVEIYVDLNILELICQHHPDQNFRTIARLLAEILVLRKELKDNT